MATIQIFRDYSQAPTCIRKNMLSLLKPCAAFKSVINEDGTSTSEQVHAYLEAMEREYAIGAAVCELKQAGVTASTPCLSFDPDSTRGSKHSVSQPSVEAASPKYDPARTAAQTQCLSTWVDKYEGHGQAWDSYSNHRVEASTLCRLVRSEAEKEEMLDLYEMLARAADGILKQSSESKEMSQELQRNLQAVQNGLREMMTDLRRETQEQFAALVRELEELRSNTHSISQDISIRFDRIKEDTDSTGDIISRNQERSRQATEDIHNRLAFVREVAVQELIQQLSRLNSTSEASTALAVNFHDGLQQLVPVLAHSLNAVQELQGEVAGAAQEIQQLRTDLSIAREALQAHRNETDDYAADANAKILTIDESLDAVVSRVGDVINRVRVLLDIFSLGPMTALVGYSLFAPIAWLVLSRLGLPSGIIALALAVTGLSLVFFLYLDYNDILAFVLGSCTYDAAVVAACSLGAALLAVVMALAMAWVMRWAWAGFWTWRQLVEASKAARTYAV